VYVKNAVKLMITLKTTLGKKCSFER
jgi:hypothetical protein